jgi:DNA-binding transcriptional ArsR family regulator
MSRAVNPQVDERLLFALGDLTRQRIVTMLNERVATAREIAVELGLDDADVASHLSVLIENDAVEPSDASRSDGTWYRATIRPFLDDAHWACLAVELRRALFGQNIRQIMEHVTPAVADGGFDDPKAHVSLTRLDLDDRGWSEVADLLAGVLEEIMDIHSESIDRITRGESESTVPAELVILHFRRLAREARGRAGSTTGRVDRRR